MKTEPIFASRTARPIDDPRDRLDMRASIYHHAAHCQPGYTVRNFVECLRASAVLDRPQLLRVNGRPC